MNLPQQISTHIREIHFGGNWTWSNLKDNLSGITWQQATTKLDSCNTIAALVYHMNYFVSAVLKVLQGGVLDAHDKFSFDLPPIHSMEDWENLLNKTWNDAEKLAGLVELLTEPTLWETFCDEKYGTYYRNLQGVIEHTHYHLGQIVIIKKIILQKEENGS
jgi:hypothetical protein